MASYGVFLAACGFEYHGPKGHIGFAPRLTPENFKAAFTTAEGWGSFSQTAKSNELHARIEVQYERLRLRSIALAPVKSSEPRMAKTVVHGRTVGSRLELQDEKVLVALAEDVVLNPEEGLDVVVA